MHIGIVVGEASGDILGASLIQALQKKFPSCQFSGIGGQRMIDLGFHSLYPQDRLAVMGFVEPLKRLPELLSIRRSLYQYFLDQAVDVVIGIDSPDFNLHLEKKLRQKNIKTVHYVSPSVWAWRQGRITLIKQAVDLMLTLLPFEAEFYRQHDVNVRFVGHPLADEFPLENTTASAREELNQYLSSSNQTIDDDKIIIACMPGSREGEVKYIGPELWHSMDLLYQQKKSLVFVIPALNKHLYQQINAQLEQYSHLPIILINGHSHTIMSAANCVVMASGTTTLEAMLLKKPMVVVYKKDILSYAIISRLLKVEYISLPNLLANTSLVPELLQEQATAKNIAESVLKWLTDEEAVFQLEKKLTQLHHQLRLNASQCASDAIADLIES